MKLFALMGAGVLAATAVGAAPADAQRYGYRHDNGWHGAHRGHAYGHRYRPGPRYHRGGYGYRGYRGGYARSRVVCRVTRGYYGPVRRCFRVYR